MTVPVDRTSRRRGALTVALVVATVGLVTLVAGGGRVPIAIEGTGGWHLDPPAETEARSGAPTEEDDTGPAAGGAQDGAGVLKETIALVLAGIALALIVRTLVRSRRPAISRVDMSRDTIPDTPAAELLDEAVEQGLVALASGSTDDVIVACWLRLEEAAARAGVERAPAETAAELAARVLSELGAPAGSVDTLLGLYRAERYSRHRLDDADRAAALDSLETIRGSIRGKKVRP